MWTWLLLLALVVFILYWWGTRPTQTAPSCNTCAKRPVSPMD
jgi:hypothetical protein